MLREDHFFPSFPSVRAKAAYALMASVATCDRVLFWASATALSCSKASISTPTLGSWEMEGGAELEELRRLLATKGEDVKV